VSDVPVTVVPVTDVPVTDVPVTDVHLVVPAGIDDPARPSGGNTYDRRVRDGLTAIGWTVREHAVAGAWPAPDATDHANLARVIADIADDAIVLIDGLIASTVPAVLVPAADRLRLVVLVHMPLGGASERAVLSAAAAVVTTSEWTRHQLLDAYALPPSHVHVAVPGVDGAELAPGTAGGAELLCVAAVTPLKGHDVLLAALATLTDLRWHCEFVGSVTRDPEFVNRLGHQARADGVDDRVRLTGPLTDADLDRAYARADVLVLPSHAETYGMVVTEALAHGLPVIATEVGGVPEALGRGRDGSRPGLLVPPGDPTALASALRGWLDEADLRNRLRHAATDRRRALPGWSYASDRISQVLTDVSPRPVLT
jgi:glycosyltransferase involved in cell wall biosynthesis